MYANVLCESQRGIAFVAFAKFIHPPRSFFDRHISTSHWNSWGGKALGVPQLELACSSSPRPAFQMLGMCSKYSLLYTKHLSAFFMVRFSDLSPSGHSSLVCQGPSYSVRFTICKIALWQTLGWFHWTQLEPWGQVVWYSHLLKNFPQFIVIHTVKGFDIVKCVKKMCEGPYKIKYLAVMIYIVSIELSLILMGFTF